MAYLEELLPEFRKGAKIRRKTWNKNEFIYMKKCTLFNEEDLELDGTEMDIWDTFIANDWELAKDPEPDWQYIIDNKCLCYFWDENFNWAMYGILGKIEKGAEYRFTMFDEAGCRSSYKNCRPIRKDEVTFYEDKKDE